MVGANRILFVALWHINNTYTYKDDIMSGEDGMGWNSEIQNVENRIQSLLDDNAFFSNLSIFLQNLLIDSHRLLASFEELAGPPPQGPPVSLYSLNPR
jgi:hypothetical protein